jgi:hypothetical protein
MEDMEKKLSSAQGAITSNKAGALSGLRADFQNDLDDFNKKEQQKSNDFKKSKKDFGGYSQLPRIGGIGGMGRGESDLGEYGVGGTQVKSQERNEVKAQLSQ